MLDPFSLLVIAGQTVSAIQKGCELLAQGKAEINKIKKAVDDAQSIVKEAKGIWSTIKSLFVKPKPQAILPAITPTKQEKKVHEPEPELSYEEFQSRAIYEICENLKKFFEIKRQLIEYCHQLEEESKTTDKIEASAIDRVRIGIEIEKMNKMIREAMIYTPKDMGLQDIYSRFLAMYDEILEERQFARDLAAKKKRDELWQQSLLRNHRIDRAVTVAWVLLLMVEMWGLMLSLGWLGKILDGSQ